MSVRPATSIAEFVADPVGRYVTGRRHAVFCPAPDLFGHASWGRPDAADARDLLAACEAGLGLGPHRYLVDLRGLEWIEPSTFGPFVDYVRRHAATLGQRLVGQAQLRPDGLVGAIISGFSHIASLPYPERVFDDVDAALGWLGVDHARGVAFVDTMERVRRGVGALHPLVARVRRMLAEAGPLTLDEVARRTGLSARSLQRGLGEAGTSFRGEHKAYQIERAKDLLRDDSRTLTWIAFELGFSSLQHFTTAFRRATGEPPSAWRARRDERTGLT